MSTLSKLKWTLSITMLMVISVAGYFHFRTTLPTPSQAVQLYSPGAAGIVGNPNGAVTVVEFFGYRCAFCRKQEWQMRKLLKNNSNIRVIYKGYPLFGQRSMFPLQAALAANIQGHYARYHSLLLRSPTFLSNKEVFTLARALNIDLAQLKRDMQDPRLIAAIRRNATLARHLNVHGAPTFFFTQTRLLNNLQNYANIPQLRHAGYLPLDKLQAYIAKVMPAST